MSEETPRKIIDIIDSDDEDTKTPARAIASTLASPFGAPKSSSGTGNGVPANTGQILHFVPTPVHVSEDAMPTLGGMMIVVTGPNVEYPFFQPLIKKDDYALNVLHVTPWSFDFKPDGKNIVKNSKSYPRKAIIWAQYPNLPALTEQDCKNVYNMWMDMLVNNRYMQEKFRPTLHPVDGYKVVKAWSEYLPISDFQLLFDKSHIHEKYANLKSFFKASKNNLYSYWPVGKVPVKEMKLYGLRKYLHDDDVAILNAAFPPQLQGVDTPDAIVDAPGATDNVLPNNTAANPFGVPRETAPARATRNLNTQFESIESNPASAAGSEEKKDESPSQPNAKRARTARGKGQANKD